MAKEDPIANGFTRMSHMNVIEFAIRLDFHNQSLYVIESWDLSSDNISNTHNDDLWKIAQQYNIKDVNVEPVWKLIDVIRKVSSYC